MDRVEHGKLIITSVILVIALLASAAYAAHPADGSRIAVYPPGTVLGTKPESWSLNDLSFSGKLPEIENLSWAEQYVVAGLDQENAPEGVSSLPWGETVINAAIKIHSLHGYIPLRLTPDELRSIPAYAEWSIEQLEMFRSPLTGEWPYLQQATSSPGDIYMRNLTEEEVHHFADLSPRLNRLWIEGYDKGFDAEGEIPVKICGGIYYARIYGWSAPLFEGFRYTVTHR